MKRILWVLGILFLVVVAAAILLTVAIRAERRGVDSAEADPLPVSVIEVEERPSYTMDRRFVGAVESIRTTKLGFEVAGTITEIRVEEGDAFDRGDILARLDTQRMEAGRDEARAALRRAEADVALAETTLKRTREARAVEAVSQQELDEARERRNALRAAVEQARARLRSVEVDLDKAVLRAPYAGVVRRRLVDEGHVTPPSAPVLDVQETRAPRVRIGVAADVTDQVAPGSDVRVELGGMSYSARVEAVLPQRDMQLRTVDVLLRIEGQDLAARPGDLAVLPLETRQEQPGFWVPLTALTESIKGMWSVYAVKAGEGEGATALERRPVEVLYQNGVRAFVRGALTSGETVVADGAHRVVPGQPVRVMSSARGAAEEEAGAP